MGIIVSPREAVFGSRIIAFTSIWLSKSKAKLAVPFKAKRRGRPAIVGNVEIRSRNITDRAISTWNTIQNTERLHSDRWTVAIKTISWKKLYFPRRICGLDIHLEILFQLWIKASPIVCILNSASIFFIWIRNN